MIEQVTTRGFNPITPQWKKNPYQVPTGVLNPPPHNGKRTRTPESRHNNNMVTTKHHQTDKKAPTLQCTFLNQFLVFKKLISPQHPYSFQNVVGYFLFLC